MDKRSNKLVHGVGGITAKIRVSALFAVFSFCLMSGAGAVPYLGNMAYTYHQPDGSTFSVKLYGDEFFAYQRTLDGHEVVKDPNTGYWCYARLAASGQSFESSGIPVVDAISDLQVQGLAATEGLAAPNQKLPDDVVLDRVREAQVQFCVDSKGRPLPHGVPPPSGSLEPPSRTTVGAYVGLCILVDFSDEHGTLTQTQVSNMCNQPSGYVEFDNACSVNEYFRIQSSGLFNYTQIVTAYVRMPKPKTYYDNNQTPRWGSATNQELVITALNTLMAQGFDFTALSRDESGRILAINVFYAGSCASGWGLGLWPEQWEIPDKTVDSTHNIIASRFMITDMGKSLSIGTFCHENGHLICLFPDLYSYISEQPDIVGYYSLMCVGCWGGDGRHPNNIDPYLKMKAGWAVITEVSMSSSIRVTAQANQNAYCKFTNPSKSKEYFLIENRNDTGYEGPYGGDASSVAPGRGLVIWQILEDGDNTEASIQSNGGYRKPYEAMIIEASPTSNYTPWYADPNPFPDDSDTFYAGHGADPLNDNSRPDVHFWNHAASTGRTVASGMILRSYDVQGSSLSYTIGKDEPADEGEGEDEPLCGSLIVTLSPAAAVSAGAQWCVDGGAWQNSGVTLTNLSAVEHTVSFKQTQGYTTPKAQAVIVSANTISPVTGVYTPTSGSITVTLEPPEACNAGAQWQMDDGPWQDSGANLTKVNAGHHSVAFKTVSGWTAPTPVTVTITAGQSHAVQAGYAGANASDIQDILLEGFDEGDKSGDGQLSYSEAYSIAAGLTRDVFNVLDTDHNGYLSKEELGGTSSGCGCSKAKHLGNWRRHVSDLFLIGMGLLALTVGYGGRSL